MLHFVNYLFDVSKALVRKLDPMRLLGLIMGLFLPFLLIIAFFPEIRSEFFSKNSELSDTQTFITAIAVIIAIFGLFLVIASFQNFMEKSILSSSEINDRQVLDDIQNLRRKIEGEKDEEITNKLRAQEVALRKELSEYNLEGLREKSGKLSSDWREAILLARSRLLAEAERLKARSRGNLGLGILISLLAVGILTYLIFVIKEDTPPADWFHFLTLYAPRFTLVLIIQFLATFFLRMYVANEKDIRRNKNEITNLELRLTAGMLVGNSVSERAKLAQILISEERNFILEKKESSFKELANAESGLKSVASVIKDLKP